MSLKSPRVIGRSGKDITAQRKNLSRRARRRLADTGRASKYTKGVVSKHGRPSPFKITNRKKILEQQKEKENKPRSLKPDFDFKNLISPFSKIKGVFSGKTENTTDVVDRSTNKIRDMFNRVIPDIDITRKITDKAQGVYEGITAPVTKTVESKNRFDALVKLAGLVGVLGTIIIMFKKK